MGKPESGVRNFPRFTKNCRRVRVEAAPQSSRGPAPSASQSRPSASGPASREVGDRTPEALLQEVGSPAGLSSLPSLASRS